MAPLIDVRFSVKCKTRPGEVVCVVGDHPDLGEWSPHRAKTLGLERQTDQGEIWAKSIKLPTTLDLKYRYFIAHRSDSDDDGEEPDVMVIFWETNMHPRTLSMPLYCNDQTGNNPPPSEFGYYDGKKSIDRGWLTTQSEIHIRLHSNPIYMWKAKYRQQTYMIKCTALDLRNRDFTFEQEESNHDLLSAGCGNKIRVSVLNKNNHDPVEQDQYGTIYNEDDYMTFRVQTFEQEYLGYQFEFYVHDPNGGPDQVPKPIGNSYILPQNLKDTCGVSTFPITGLQNKPIGRFSADYLIINPIKQLHCNMEVSYSRHWKHNRRALDVAHRGMGSTFNSPMKMQQCELAKENTIASLTEAGSCGADFVEFDVQLTKDKVPVIYHDYMVALTLKKKYSDELDWFELPVSELSLDQLQMLKLDHVSQKSRSNPCPSPVEFESIEKQCFPQLKMCLERLDTHIGFNIEIKYCMHLKTGEREEGLKYFHERNDYLDIILSDVLKYAGDRRIIFSSFDPEICSMIRLKQNKYPVMFLCLGNTAAWTPYKDIRCCDYAKAFYYSIGEHLLGVIPHTEDLLKDPSVIAEGKKMGLVLFCWGEDNNSRENIKNLKDLGIDGVIYDRISELKESKENVFKMELDTKVDLLSSMGLLNNGAAASRVGTSTGGATVQTGVNANSHFFRSQSEEPAVVNNGLNGGI